MMRPGERTNDDIQYYQKFFESLFMDPDRYDLSAVGRMKFNSRLDPGQDLGTSGVLTKEDLVGVELLQDRTLARRKGCPRSPRPRRL